MIPASAGSNGSHNGPKRTVTATLGRAYAFIRSEKSITKIRHELLKLKAGPSGPMPRTVMLMAYPLAEVRKGTAVILGPRENGVYVKAEEFRKYGANYFIRLLLPTATNLDAAGTLEGCFNLEKFRLEVFGREAAPLAETYFKDDHGVYVSMAQFRTAMAAMERLGAPARTATGGEIC